LSVCLSLSVNEVTQKIVDEFLFNVWEGKQQTVSWILVVIWI